MDTRLPPKVDICRALLLKGSVFIHLDPRNGEVVVPDHLRLQPQVVLQIGRDMPVPIPDLRVDEVGVYGTLSFKGILFTCSIPWHAVFAVVGEDAKGIVWSSELPGELRDNIERENNRKSADVVALDTSAQRKNTSARRPASKNTSRPPYLRLMK
jgi:stringent starvation protein B